MAFAVALSCLASGAFAVPISGQGTWETDLKARDINGNPVALNAASAVFYYDTALDITWLRDWNVNGLRNWSTQMAWAAGLTVGGFDDWRLPTTTDSNNDGCSGTFPGTGFSGGTDCGYNVDTGSSELAHMYYVTLGNLAFCPPGDADCNPAPQAGWGLTNTAEFLDMQSSFYWSGTEYAPDRSSAWTFNTSFGFQGVEDKGNALYAVAVRPGDVAAAVPEPQTFALALAALAALRLARRRRPH
jgi:MYXO-CTERM domain-containing protein